ncbi:MAG: SusC/RagA family TonB-linked outer membrane protein [Rikenellaceae bacterium]|jgi:TonB-linked SusC/RagA family outer membrane protein|nr:SusC/RagA family TonB-linked outer membrane protein [Rikenellaceae bacterium]
MKKLYFAVASRFEKRVATALFFTLLFSGAGAQPDNSGSVVSGRVADRGGNYLSGVTVASQDANRTVVTDASGRYRIALPANGTLTFSCVGYQPQTVAVGVRTTIDVVMELAEQKIEDVIVTGYQTINKKHATGSYAVVNEETLSKKPVSNISSALKGLVPGMATVSSTIDGQDRFVIRGQGTLQTGQADRDPLIVVDGFPIQGFTNTSVSNLGGDGLLNAKDPFGTINPNDIESISVLKDAAATSIYGARASNGVIVITTKKGKGQGKLDVKVGGFFSVSSKPDLDYLFNMASAKNQFRYIENLRQYHPSYFETYNNPYYSSTNPFVYHSDAASLLREYADRASITEAEYNSRKAELIAQGDKELWKDDLNRYVYRNSIHQQYDISLRGGSDIHNYSLSAVFDTEKGYAIGNDTRKITVNAQNGVRLHKRITLNTGVNFGLVQNTNNGVALSTLKSGISPWSRLVDDNGGYPHLSTIVALPNAIATGSASSLTTMYHPILTSRFGNSTAASWSYNPVEDRQYMDNSGKRVTARLFASLDYNVIDGLNLSARGQYERNQYAGRATYDPKSYFVRNYVNTYSTLNAATGRYDTYFPSGGIFNDVEETFEGYNLRGQIDYHKTFGKHFIRALVGSEVISSSHTNVPNSWRYGYNRNTNAVLSTVDYVTLKPNIFGTSVRLPFTAPGGLTSLQDRFFSAYADAEYVYSDRYTLTASLRTDASNFQALDVRDKFSPFWSVGGSWLASREEFMSGLDWVDFLKLRGSFGVAGFAAGKSGMSSVTTLSVSAGSILYTNNEAYNSISARGNPTLTWEKSRTFNVGADFSLWQDKLYGSVEYYNKYSYDVLSRATVPTIMQGVTDATFNNAAISNNGVEFSLGSRQTIVGDLKWDGILNFAYNKNTVRSYNLLSTDRAWQIPVYTVGYPANSIWAYNLAGYTPEGYMVLKGKDGTTEVVTDRETTHLYDAIVGEAGATKNHNWMFYMGSGTPTTNAAFSNTFTYKGITLSLLVTGKFGYWFARNDMFGASANSASYPRTLNDAIATLDAGYPTQKSYTNMPLYNEDNVDIFRQGSTWSYMTNLHNASQAGYLKGDHIRLNEIYLGYELPGRLLGSQKVIRGVNIFAQAKNLGLLWSSNKVMDPDYPIGGVKPMKTFTFGVKLNFN